MASADMKTAQIERAMERLRAARAMTEKLIAEYPDFCAALRPHMLTGNIEGLAKVIAEFADSSRGPDRELAESFSELAAVMDFFVSGGKHHA